MPDPRQGVFETLLVLDGRPVELEAHLERLNASLAQLFPDLPTPDLDPLDVPVENGVMRIDVMPGGDRLEARVSFREPEERCVPIALHSLALAGGLGSHKWADRSLLDEAQSELPDSALPLIVDTDGAVLEASRANLFAVRDGALFTPPLDGRILPGITRMRVLEIAWSAGIELREQPLACGDLLDADDIFLTGSVRGIEHVDSLDGRRLDRRREIANCISAELWSVWRMQKSQARVPNRMSARPGRSMTKRDGYGTVPA